MNVHVDAICWGRAIKLLAALRLQPRHPGSSGSRARPTIGLAVVVVVVDAAMLLFVLFLVELRNLVVC